MTQQAMVDTSIFQGIMDFTDNDGREIRAESRGGGMHNVSIKRGDAYIQTAIVRIRGEATPHSVLRAMDAE